MIFLLEGHVLCLALVSGYGGLLLLLLNSVRHGLAAVREILEDLDVRSE